MTTTAEVRTRAIAFMPSRLAHANMFVANVEKSIAFYRDVAGIELVRREPEIFMAFHSNGATHHDVGLVQVKPGDRLGIDGFVQVSSNRATKPGLNHLGWEMLSEVDLLAAMRRAKSAGQALLNSANHQLSHATYVVDPDGNYHEFFADTVENWRSIFNLDHEELVTEAWDWENSGPGFGPMPMDPADRRRVDSAIFHPRRLTHCTLAVNRFDDVLDFMTHVGGLALIEARNGVATLRGARSSLDLLLVSTAHGMSAGLYSISFEVEDEQDFMKSRVAAWHKGLGVITERDAPHKKNMVIADPDRVQVEFYYRIAKGMPSKLPQPDGQPGHAWIMSA